MEKTDKNFQYTYSAAQRAEVEKILENYRPREESKLERLRRLDASVSKKAACRALSLGIVGTLILGTGMSLVMTDLAAGLGLGLSHGLALLLGIGLGLFGMALAALAYPVYERTVKKERQRIAPEILRLAEELLD